MIISKDKDLNKATEKVQFQVLLQENTHTITSRIFAQTTNNIIPAIILSTIKAETNKSIKMKMKFNFKMNKKD